MNISQEISKTTKISTKQILSVLELLNQGNTVPFISRYRKEATGNLNDEQIHTIENLNKQFTALNERKTTIINSITEQGKLTDKLKSQIELCTDKQQLEDIYLPYKQKRKTKASEAIEKGLMPLAQIILKQKTLTQNKQDTIKQFINPSKGIKSNSNAIEEALYIVAQEIAENHYYRNHIRKSINYNADIVTKVKKEFVNQKTKFEAYYNHKEKFSRIASHRLLAIKRAETEKVISWKLEMDTDIILSYLEEKIIYKPNHEFIHEIKTAIKDSFKRLIFPSLENECFNEKLDKAHDESISVFSKNLKNLLLSPPAGSVCILGIDPGFRTGCKIAVIDQTGTYKKSYTIFPNEPHQKTSEATRILLSAIHDYNPELIAIGNGTASKETFSFVKKIIKENSLNCATLVVSESGASVYSASDVARQEFPELDVTVRGAISIARRLQDPLAELVKIDPKSIGVGQYQHDVNQKKLKEELDYTIESCVNFVGVDVNTASAKLLSHIAGIGPTIAENIIKYRTEKGSITSRTELLKINKLGPKAYQQCAGFLRIKNGKNPLDNSAIHPESYNIVELIAKDINTSTDKLVGNNDLINKIDINKYVSAFVGIHTLNDLKEELLKPGLDPRKEFNYADFNDDIDNINDLKKDMTLNGVITNVTNFGAFVDIGVHQDGLIHISQLSDTFVKDPYAVVSVGDQITVTVLDIEVEKKRISLKRVIS